MPDYHLEIPERPTDPEPILKSGWQWVNAHWAAYWLAEQNDLPNNHPENIRKPRPYIASIMDTLHWLEDYDETKEIFAKILNSSLKGRQGVSEPDRLLERWYREAGLSFPIGADYPTIMQVIALHIDNPEPEEPRTRGEIINKYFSDPIYIASYPDKKSFGEGRHRTYAAWEHKLPDVFMWVNLIDSDVITLVTNH